MNHLVKQEITPTGTHWKEVIREFIKLQAAHIQTSLTRTSPKQVAEVHGWNKIISECGYIHIHTRGKKDVGN